MRAVEFAERLSAGANPEQDPIFGEYPEEAHCFDQNNLILLQKGGLDNLIYAGIEHGRVLRVSTVCGDYWHGRLLSQ